MSWKEFLIGGGALVSFLALVIWGSSVGDARMREDQERFERSRDRACEREMFVKCLEGARGPQSTHYTDQEETVATCASDVVGMCQKAAP